MGVWVVSTTPRPLYTRERPGTHCTGGWVGPRAGLAWDEVALSSMSWKHISSSPSRRSFVMSKHVQTGFGARPVYSSVVTAVLARG